MGITWIIRHQWKETTRSVIWQKNLALNIVIGFFVLVMFLYLLMLGIFLNKILPDIFPDDDPTEKLNSFLLYYFLSGFILRFIMQKLPVLSVNPYLHLPVKKNFLARFLLLKSALHIINFLPLLVFLPFAVMEVSPMFSPTAAFSWLFFIFLLIFFNNYMVFYFKKQLSGNIRIVAVLAVIILSLILLDHYKILSLSGLSLILFSLPLQHIIYVLIPLPLIFIILILNRRMLRQSMYLDRMDSQATGKKNGLTDIRYLKKFGQTGELLLLELKLILRHKRTKSLLYMLPLFWLYGFIFYNEETYMRGFSMLLFAGIFITGGFMMAYGNYLFSWESQHFDALLAHSVEKEKYLKAKYFLLFSSCVLSFIVTMPYCLYGIKVFFINSAAFLFNIGINIPVFLYFSTYNRKRMDLSGGSMFNWQGISGSNFIIVFPILFLPTLLHLPFSLAGLPYVGLWIISGLGITGVVFQSYLMKIVEHRFQQKKYLMAEGFRKK